MGFKFYNTQNSITEITCFIFIPKKKKNDNIFSEKKVFERTPF